MKTKTLKYITACLVSCGIVAAVTSCADWDDHYDPTTAQTANAQLTLWKQLQQNPQLSDFCQVLQQTKVFRNHKKTAVSYADLLDQGQTFTLVAPVNNSFNRDSLLQLVQTNQGDSIVEKTFIMNHLSRSTTSLGSEAASSPSVMLMLNSKHLAGNSQAIEGVAVTTPNIHARNGILHVALRPMPYRQNLYEALSFEPQLSSIGAMLRQYEHDRFDPDASVSAGIVEGVPVYVDSVVVEENTLLQRIGYINAEDSTYWVLAPTQQAWQKAFDEAAQYFQYDETVLKRDSIQQFWTLRALLDDAVFNYTEQQSPTDSLISVPYRANRNYNTTRRHVYHRFLKPFEPGGILYNTTQIPCSNGILYTTDQWPFSPTETYLRELWSEAEQVQYITADKDCSYNIRRLAADSISESGYLQIIPRTATANWDLTMRVNNTLSGTYDICAIILPKAVANPNNPDLKPNKFKATISYVDMEGKTQTFNCNNTQFQNDPLRVDTVVIAEAFQFPTCNYDQNDIKVTVKLQCSILARETSRYAREMFLDCIYLRPRKVNN
ncbi:MAG: fasciclin domain-containing protein [Prevotella sp.]|nr:fasciclin domain-containing protein [Prevotella sp.]